MSGSYNDTHVGYREVLRIPAGASNIDIRQHSFEGKTMDTTYLGEDAQQGARHRAHVRAPRVMATSLSSTAVFDPETSQYLINGNFVVTLDPKVLMYGGVTIDYSGGRPIVERLNCTRMLKRELIVHVSSLCSEPA